MSAGVVRAAQRTAQRALAGVSRVLAGQPTPDTHPEVGIDLSAHGFCNPTAILAFSGCTANTST